MAMSAQEAASAELFSESDPHVLVIYVTTFAIWTAAAGHDFISPTWKTVRDTRRCGKVHVALAFMPMVPISFYISSQHKTRDYKEMGAALVALAFAVLHLLRTFMGLWQLHMFKKWTISAIKSMESLGYDTHWPRNVVDEPDEHSDDGGDYDSSSESEIDGIAADEKYDKGIEDDEFDDGSESESWEAEINNTSSGAEIDSGSRNYDEPAENRRNIFSWFCVRSPASKGILSEHGDRIERIAERILVNATIIDNRLSDVHTVCNFRMLSTAENKRWNRPRSLFNRLCFILWYGLLTAPRSLWVMYNLTVYETPVIPNVDSGPRLVPRHPESVWIKWATALVAQVRWVLDESEHTDPDPAAMFADYRKHFAEQILLSAALHTGRRGSESIYQDSTSRGLAFKEWYKYPKFCNGQFVKQEFLRRACRTGNGLPYYAPHKNAKVGRKTYGYGSFESELKRAREELPTEFEKRMEGFKVKNLEWFAIFVSIEDWGFASSSSVTHACSTEASSDNSDSKSDSRDMRESDGPDSENQISIENLKKQLGFSDDSNFALGRSKLPLLRNIPKITLWGNRNILEASCHIDNWMALCVGEQTAYMTKHVPWMDRLKKSFSGQLPKRASRSSDDNESVDNAAQETVEKYRMMCQMAIVDPQHCHFEKSIKFLGCNMEMLRTSLAKWKEAHPQCSEGSWKPLLFFKDDIRESSTGQLEIRFLATRDFTSCLRSIRRTSDMLRRFVSMRLLWEIQDHIQKKIQEAGCAPSSIEAIALCILSFPAVSVQARCVKPLPEVTQGVPQGTNCVIKLRREFHLHEYEYIIDASCGPQDFQLVVSFEPLGKNSNAWILLRLCQEKDKDGTNFHWEAWRNAFCDRLEATREWKEKLGFLESPLISSTNPIFAGIQQISVSPKCGTGAKMSVWKGWLPHRASISMYEIATEGFVLQPAQGGGTSLRVRVDQDERMKLPLPQKTLMPVTYAEADVASLTNASLVAHDILEHSLGFEEDVEVLSTFPDSETIITGDSHADVNLALRRIEVAAIHGRDTKALERAVRILLRGGKNRRVFERGIALLERFYVFGNQGSEETEQNSRRLFSFFANEDFVKALSSLFERIFKASGYDRLVAERYQLFLMFLKRYGRSGQVATTDVMARSIFYRSFAMDASESAASILTFGFPLHSSDSPEDLAVLDLAYSNVAHTTEELLIKRSTPKLISLLKKVQSNAACNWAAALRKGFRRANGMDILRDLNVNLKRVARRCMKSIYRSGDMDAMTHLGNIITDDIEQYFPPAVEVYSLAAEMGDTNAMYYLANLLCTGERGVQQDVARAVELLERSINEGGNVNAMNLLGSLLGRGKQAFRHFSKALARGNHSDAMHKLASLLPTCPEQYTRRIRDLLNWSRRAGRIVDASNLLDSLLVKGEDFVQKSIHRAAHLYSRAIDEGNHTGAMYNLASILYTGAKQVKQNIPRAVELLQRSINEGGNADAMNLLGMILAKGGNGVERDITRASRLFSRAIDDGNHAGAMYNLAVLLYEGKEGIARDEYRAGVLLNRAVAAGHVEAMVKLADLLGTGRCGQYKNIERALGLYQRAADEGRSTRAMNKLAYLLETGIEGVEKDLPRAARLYERAVDEDGNEESMLNLGNLLARGGDGVSLDLPRAVRLFENALLLHTDIAAMERLASILHAGGDGIVKDVGRAIALYTRAVEEGGSITAMDSLAHIFETGDGVAQDHVRAAQLRHRITQTNH